MNATRGGAIMAPRLEPLLQIPITNVRAFFGTHVAAALANAGHAPASPMARMPRNAPRLQGPRASAVIIPANDHHPTANVSPRATPTLSRNHPANEYATAYTARNAFRIAAYCELL